MLLTKHARDRWLERFPELDPAKEWADASTSTGRVGKRRLAKIRASCPAHEVSKDFKGVYYKLSPSGVVFVVTPPETVITVFPLEKEE